MLLVELVARHGDEQLEQLGRRVELELARRRTHEEVRQHRLADVGGVDDAAQPRAGKAHAHDPPDFRLVQPDQRCRSLAVPRADLAYQFRKCRLFKHGSRVNKDPRYCKSAPTTTRIISLADIMSGRLWICIS